MPITDHKIKKAPKLHAALAKKHNKLVDLLKNLQGKNGAVVKSTNGNILLTLDPQTIDDPAAWSAVISSSLLVAVGTDGYLYSAGTNTSTNTYPTLLKTVTSGKKITLDSNGIELDNNAGQTVRLFFSAMTHSMSIKTINVCSGGVTKSMDILASDPY